MCLIGYIVVDIYSFVRVYTCTVGCDASGKAIGFIYSQQIHSKRPPSTSTGLKQSTLVDCVSKAQPYPLDKKKSIDRVLGWMIAKDLQPFSVVEDEGFRVFCKTLQPRYELPCRSTVTKLVCKELHEESAVSVQQDITESASVSLTTDAWTSRATQSYITVTAHVLDKAWNFRSYVLDTTIVADNHTADNLAEHLVSTMTRWHIHEKLTDIYVTTDNAANVVKACEVAKVCNMPCFAHTINLAAQKGIGATQVSNALAHVRDVVKYFHRSTLAASALCEAQANADMPPPRLKLILDTKTRWNSTYDMVTRFKDLHPAIGIALYNRKLNASEASDKRRHFEKVSVEILSELSTALKPLYDATKLISGDYVTVSMVHPLKSMLIDKLTIADRDSEIVKTLKRTAGFDLKSRYNNPSIVKFLITATVLDPRFKSLNHIKPEERDQAFEYARNAVIQHHRRYEDADEAEPTSQPSSTVTNSTVLDSLFGEIFTQNSDTRGVEDEVQQELTSYQAVPALNINDNPLDWWAANQPKFPHIAKLTKSILTVQATSVPSERVFSTAGDVVSEKRSRLLPEHVNSIIFLHQNRKRP